MAITDTQKVDYLFKKVGYGLSKTDVSTVKSPSNETVSSPLLTRGDSIWQQNSSIPAAIPASNGNIVVVYSDALSSTIQTTADATSSTSRTWKTGLIDWIDTSFGSTYQVKVYLATTGNTQPQTYGIQLFSDGSGTSDEWFFDYQSGVLNFAGTNLPTQTYTGKSIFISGARYIGLKGYTTISNVNFSGTTVSSVGTNANLVLSSTGSGYVVANNVIVGNLNVTSNLLIGGNANIIGNLTVSSGNAYINGPGSSLSVGGSVGIVPSTNTTTGALVVTGGVGIAGNLNTGALLNAGTNTSGAVAFFGTTGSNARLILQAGATNNGIWTEGTSTLTIAPNSAMSSGITVNNNGNINIITTAPSSTTSTGALIVSGGVGIAGNLNIGANLAIGPGSATTFSNVTIYHTTPSTTYTTGALIVNGGVGISGNLNVAGNLIVGNVYTQGYAVLSNVSTITITGDATGSGNFSNIAITLANTGVISGMYGAADSESLDKVPIITVDSKGRITNIANVSLTRLGNLVFSLDTITSNSASGNIYLNAPGNGIVQILGTDAIGIPVGTSSQRLELVGGSPKVGYLRYNTSISTIEFWNGTYWDNNTQQIVSKVFTPTGSGNTFVLDYPSTTTGVIVSINGTMQQPYVSYQVTGNVITFIENPITSDIIEVRTISGAKTVNQLIADDNSSAVVLVAGGINMLGNVIVTGNIQITNDVSMSAANLLTTTTTINQILDTFSISSYRSAKYIIQATCGSSYQTSEIMLIHDGVTTYQTEYGLLTSGAPLATFSSEVQSNNVHLLVSPASSYTTIRYRRDLISI